jgi:hypothetical protein
MICNPVLDPLIGGCNQTTTGSAALALILARMFRAVTVVGGLALLLYLAWGGVNWITSGGDKGKVEEAQHKITNAVLGMAFLVAVVAIANLLQGVFGFDILNPTLPGTP